ncbi:hypothetical protein N0V90_001876 [Kalmusia sp. IMI 367209]|nr:hypothetical protein N0V90_001876 [Kalmusia sp. IMI 367209]
MIKAYILLLASIVPALATPLSARATNLICDDPVCGGDILYNNNEVWQGYLVSLAEQLDIDPNQDDLINVIKRAGGGWCKNVPDTGVPSDP